jgi:glycosyltransferase involved in cell wall biosynthesis
LQQATIGILTSQSEGLPVALLEYGWHKKPVVVTAVGEIPSLITNGTNGFLVAAQQPVLFYEALVTLINSKELQMEFGRAFYQTVLNHNSETTVIGQYLNWLQNSYK